MLDLLLGVNEVDHLISSEGARRKTDLPRSEANKRLLGLFGTEKGYYAPEIDEKFAQALGINQPNIYDRIRWGLLKYGSFPYIEGNPRTQQPSRSMRWQFELRDLQYFVVTRESTSILLDNE